MTLKKKILIGYGVAFVLMGLVVMWAVTNLVSLGKASDAILGETYRSILAAENMVDALEGQESAVLLIFRGDSEKGTHQFRENEAILDAMLAALRTQLTGASWIEPEGGFFGSTTLPADVDGHAVWENAKRFGLVLTDGRGFFADGKGENFVRLPFCALTPGEIDEGVRRLSRAIRAHTRG